MAGLGNPLTNAFGDDPEDDHDDDDNHDNDEVGNDEDAVDKDSADFNDDMLTWTLNMAKLQLVIFFSKKAVSLARLSDMYV